MRDAVDLTALHDRTILITGASGLIGTWLMDCLFALKLKRRGILRVFAQVKRPPSPYLAEMCDRHGFQIMRLDLSDYHDYGFLPRADVIVHAAGSGQPAVFLDRPAATFTIATAATQHLLEQLNPGGRFLFISSQAVYAGLEEAATEERIGTTTPADVRAAYIEGKRGGETLVHIARGQGRHATAVRLGATYGPGARPDDRRALYQFVRQAVSRGRIDLLDSGAAVRTYLYAADAVEMLWRVALEGTQPVYNLCGREPVTIAAVAETVARLTDAIVHYPAVVGEALPGGTVERWSDTTRLDAEFGKTEYVSLEDGLRQTIEWQRDVFDGRAS